MSLEVPGIQIKISSQNLWRFLTSNATGSCFLRSEEDCYSFDF